MSTQRHDPRPRHLLVADAPVNWGVYELDPSRPPAVDPGVFLDHVVANGYDAIELGPAGFLGDAERTRERLEDRGLRLVGAFLDLRFSREVEVREELRALPERAAFVAAAAPPGTVAMAVLSDATAEPDRLAVACRAGRHPGTWLTPDRFETLIANLHRAAEVCRRAGLEPVIHPHAGGYVETDREIRAVCERLDPSLLGLCLDTGHVRLGDADPVALLRDHRELVRHVHLKDVRPTVLAASRAEGLPMSETWSRGIFCDLGDGDVPIAAFVAELLGSGYRGSVVVEQDRPPESGESVSTVAATMRANRAYLASLGFPLPEIAPPRG